MDEKDERANDAERVWSGVLCRGILLLGWESGRRKGR